jgi:hypothetical protein
VKESNEVLCFLVSRTLILDLVSDFGSDANDRRSLLVSNHGARTSTPIATNLILAGIDLVRAGLAVTKMREHFISFVKLLRVGPAGLEPASYSERFLKSPRMPFRHGPSVSFSRTLEQRYFLFHAGQVVQDY